MQSRTILCALSLLSLSALTSVPARAATPVTSSRFSLTFPTGWQALPVQTGGDSVQMVMNIPMQSSCYLSSTTSDHPVTAQELDSMLLSSAGTDSITKVTGGTKSIGGKSFTYVEYRAADTATNGDSRIRLYYTASGTNLFSAMLIYDPATGAGAVADVETALSTLSLTTAIRAWAAGARPGLRAADHDILGRLQPLATRSVLFRLPAR